MADKFIFDTNFVNNGDINTFFGRRSELKRFSKFGDILIPDIVIDEIITHKVEYLNQNKNSFLNNPYHQLFSLHHPKITESFISKILFKLKSEENIPYQIIKINCSEALEEIRQLAINKLPPFAGTDNCSDKGFKDAYIFQTIKSHVLNDKTNNYFFVGNDGLLKNAVEGLSNCITCSCFDDYKIYRSNYFNEDYFIYSLKDYIQKNDPELFSNSKSQIMKINNITLSEDDAEWTLEVSVNKNNSLIKVDFVSKEMIGYEAL